MGVIKMMIMTTFKVFVFLAVYFTILCIVEAGPPNKSTNKSPSVPPLNHDRSERNSFGGYNYYKGGKMVGRSHSNNSGSQNIYGPKGSMMYRGQKNSVTGKEYYRGNPGNAKTK